MLTTSVRIMVVLGGLMIGCWGGTTGDAPVGGKRDDPGFNNFQTAVAAKRDFDIYWLGREFSAGGVSYRGPDVADFGDDVEGGLAMDYVADVSSLKLTLYSLDGWDRAEARRASATGRTGETFTSKSVEVGGRPAELRTYSTRFDPVSSRRLIIEIEDTFVEAFTWASETITPSEGEPNPRMDEATFLVVMADLRPYPE